jgi:hypothetical protein
MLRLLRLIAGSSDRMGSSTIGTQHLSGFQKLEERMPKQFGPSALAAQ